MKRLFIILIAALFAVSSSFAGPNYGSSNLKVSGAGTQDAASGIDDLSYDEATGQYSLYILCPLQIFPENEQNINLGYLNPDGSRMLSHENMTWMVWGGNGWYFEAWLKNDQFARNSSGEKTEYVYFVNPYWEYKEGIMGSYHQVGAAPMSGEFDQEYHINQLQLSGIVGLDMGGFCMPNPNPCSGKGFFKFHPRQVVATELAIDDRYTWDIMLGVDYLTWTTPVDPDGSDYTQPTPAP